MWKWLAETKVWTTVRFCPLWHRKEECVSTKKHTVNSIRNKELLNKKILAFVADLPVLHKGRGNRPEDRAVNLMVGQKFNCKATQTDLSASVCAGKIRIKLLPSKFFMSHCFPVLKGFHPLVPKKQIRQWQWHWTPIRARSWSNVWMCQGHLAAVEVKRR